MDLKIIKDKIIKIDKVNWREFKFIQSKDFKEISKDDFEKLKTSIKTNNFIEPFFVWENENTIYCCNGKHRCLALDIIANEGYAVPELLPAVFIDAENKKEAAKLVAIYSSQYAKTTEQGLYELMSEYGIETDFLGEIDIPNIDSDNFIDNFFEDSFKEHNSFTDTKGSLVNKFLCPPFSIFDTRQAYWQDRKKMWFDIGIVSQAGRGENLIGQNIVNFGTKAGTSFAPATSIFDPALCEIIYSWFTAEGSNILDPFAGGSVRGIVAGKLKRNYLGIDLRKEQIDENEKQKKEIITKEDGMVSWINEDSSNIDKIDYCADFIFSCPPYADLEVYSDNPQDLSNMEYSDFIKKYEEIIKKTISKLKEDRFLCFVVAEVRDKNGIYHNFVSDTIKVFIDAGMHYYNEIILINQSVTAALRAEKLIKSSRKIVKTHQNVLIFVKGDPIKATQYCGDIEVKIESSALDSQTKNDMDDDHV